MKTRERVYQAVVDHFANYGMAPTVRQIMAIAEVSSTSQVVYHLRTLERENRIILNPGKARSIQLVNQDSIIGPAAEGIELARILQIGAIPSAKNPAMTIVKTEHLTRLLAWADRISA